MKCELFNDNFQNFKRYQIPKAQLVIADIPYNIGVNAYASNPMWYVDGDNRNGESDKAGKAFFHSDVISTLWSICTSAPGCFGKSRRRKDRRRR